MRILRPARVAQGEQTLIRSPFFSRMRSATLEFSVRSRFVERLHPDRLDAQLLALLAHAMVAGEDIHADGLISRKLLYNLNSHLVPLLSSFNRRLAPIEVSAAETSDMAESVIRGAATGFSGGIDSFCTIAEHISRPNSFGPELTHLLFNNAGALPRAHVANREERLTSLALRTGLELVRIDSNLGDFIDLPYQMTHSFRNAACALLLSGEVSVFLYSSTYPYGSVSLKRDYDIAYIDPLALHLMSTEEVETISTGSQHSRVEKTAIVAAFAPARELLHVCVSPATTENCASCWKCGRTLLTLELLGHLEDFSGVFDLITWEKYRPTYIGEFLLNRNKRADPFVAEIKQLAKQRRYDYSRRERMIGLLATALPERLFRPLVHALWGN